MTIHFKQTIHPALGEVFLLFISFSIVTQMAFVSYRFYCIVDLFQHLVFLGEGKSNDQARNLLFGTQMEQNSWGNLKWLVSDFLVECGKLYLMIMALMSIFDKWKITNLGIFVLMFAFFLIIQWMEKMPYPHLTLPKQECTSDKVICQLLHIRTVAYTLVYFICISCTINIVYIHRKRFVDLTKE